jgi:Fe-S-cluster containining protein
VCFNDKGGRRFLTEIIFGSFFGTDLCRREGYAAGGSAAAIAPEIESRLVFLMASEKLSKFECRICGECCRGSQKVWLNPVDMQRLASHLGLAGPEELESRKIIVVEPGEHGIPRPRLFFSRGPAGAACRFLINDLDEEGRLWGRCSLHGKEAKPLVCRLAPLAREVDLKDGSEGWMEVPPVTGCPGWGPDSPPPEGRRISPPELNPGIRKDLDREKEFFRKLDLKVSRPGE